MGYEINKKNPKDWKENDVFALKIITDDEEFNGRYFILIRMSDPAIEWNWEYPTFRVKITRDDKIPQSKEEIENLDYIKTGFMHYIERYCGLHGNETYKMAVDRRKNNIYKPDKYGYLYFYHFTIFDLQDNVDYNDFIYLGNYDISKPIDETVIENQYCHIFANTTYDGICNKLIKTIEYLNKKDSKIFNEDHSAYVDYAKNQLRITKEIAGTLHKESDTDKFLEENDDGESETYVGSGIDWDAILSKKE